MITKRTVGQRVNQSWDCSQIENEEEEDDDWQTDDQMEMQRAEHEKLEQILERRRAEGVDLQAEVLQKVPELVVHERMSQCQKSERHGRKEMKRQQRMKVMKDMAKKIRSKRKDGCRKSMVGC